METAKAIAARADAVFLVPKVYVPDTMPDRARINIYNIRDSHYERHFYFCYRKDMYITNYEKDLLRIVCKVLNARCSLSMESNPFNKI